MKTDRSWIGYLGLGLLIARVMLAWPQVGPVTPPKPPVEVVTPPVDVPVVVNPPVVTPVDPVTQGKRTVVVIRESADDNPALARMIQNLRTGEHEAYFTQKGHRLLWLDDEQQNENGEPLPLVQELLAVHPELPALIILREDGMPLWHETLTAEPTAEYVIQKLKEQGG